MMEEGHLNAAVLHVVTHQQACVREGFPAAGEAPRTIAKKADADEERTRAVVQPSARHHAIAREEDQLPQAFLTS